MKNPDQKVNQIHTDPPIINDNSVDIFGFFKKLINSGIDAIESFSRYIEELGKKIKDPMSIEELAETFSKATDDIKNALRKDELRFIGGKLSIGPHDSVKKSVMVYLEMYSQDTSGKWKKSEASKPLPESSLTKNALEKIQEQAISFEII